jgi:DNA-binding NarL/FixJ family response regulator
MTERIRIRLTDSSALFRQCLAVMLGRGRRLEIVGEAASA